MDEEGLRRLAGCIEGSVGKGLASLSDLNGSACPLRVEEMQMLTRVRF